MVERRRPKPKLVVDNPLTDPPEVTNEQVAAATLASEVEAKLVELSKLDKVAYDRARDKAAKELEIRVSTLDDLVAERRPIKAEEAALIAPPAEPWADAVNSEGLVDELFVELCKHVIL